MVPRACKIGITLAKLWPLLNCYKIFMKFIFVLVFIVLYSYTKDFTYWVTYTVFYWLIAVATITFSEQKGVATKRGQLLYEGGH